MLIEFIKVLNHEKVHQELSVVVQADKITLKLHGALIKPTRMEYQTKVKILNVNSNYLK
jgi:transcriptional regulator of heat shock response